MASDRITARYWLESPHPVEDAAAVLAGEQSTGTFVPLPGETARIRERHAARVERIVILDSVDQPSLPGSRPPPGAGRPRYNRAEVTISFPMENVGTSLPNLVTTVAGNLFELSQLSGVRLLDLELPEAFAAAQPGPGFGVAGTRALSNVADRPLVGTIIKPSVGLAPGETAALVERLVQAGVDFIKDDELISDPPYSPLRERVAAAQEIIERHAERTGKRVMYAFNISGDVDEMLWRHEAVTAAGGTCVMVTLNSVGLSGFLRLRREAQIPIHGHRAGWGTLTRSPGIGIDFLAYQKLWRLAGVDHLHVNGLRNKFWEGDESVVASARACLAATFGTEPIMPVFSSGQWGGQAPETYRALQSVDLLYLAGGGIHAHPDGPAGGVAAIRAAWEAAIADVPLEAYAERHPALRAAIERFG